MSRVSAGWPIRKAAKFCGRQAWPVRTRRLCGIPMPMESLLCGGPGRSWATTYIPSPFPGVKRSHQPRRSVGGHKTLPYVTECEGYPLSLPYSKGEIEVGEIGVKRSPRPDETGLAMTAEDTSSGLAMSAENDSGTLASGFLPFRLAFGFCHWDFV